MVVHVNTCRKCKIVNLHNSFKYWTKSIPPKQNKFLHKGKFPSDLSFRKSRYSPDLICQSLHQGKSTRQTLTLFHQ